MTEPEEEPPHDAEVRRTATLYLSVFLPLLAFFIFLNSISTLHVVRAKAVMDSLATAFSSLLPNGEAAFAATNGNVVAAREFLKAAGEVFETAIPAAKVRIIPPGRLMQVTMLADALFLPEKADVRPGQGALLNRLVAALSTAPPGLRYEMSFTAGSPTADRLPVGEGLAVARAGALAREMVRRGAPPGTVVVGVAPGEAATAHIIFRVIADEDGRPVAPAGGGRP